MKKVELLAPAGDYTCFLGAVHAGADAVYIGGEKYGARAYAGNFTTQEVCLAIRYAHLHKRKLYLTINTLLKETETAELYGYLLPFYEEGLDGVIVQDMGVFSFIRTHFPGLPIHGSTQMTVTGPEGAGFLKKLGMERIVPARELSLAELKCLKEETDMEVEIFIHGAMCYAYSGQCLFSSMLGERSGNRGRCAQPCRLPYRILGKEGEGREGYPLSLKDMCTLSILPEILEAGVDSLKIEGRMKKAEYAAGVTAMYRKYLDLYYENPKGHYVVSPEDLKKLEALYIRSGISEGYYHRHNGKEMITPDNPGYCGTNEGYLQEIRQNFLQNPWFLEAAGWVSLHKGQPACFRVTYGDVEATSYGQTVQKALKKPLLLEDVKARLSKTGNTAFTLKSLQADMKEDGFLPVKALNELRRDAFEKLEQEMLKDTFRKAPDREKEAGDRVLKKAVREVEISKKEECQKPYLAAEMSGKKTLLAFGSLEEEADFFDRLYLPADLFVFCHKTWGKAENPVFLLREFLQKKPGRRVFLTFPRILRLHDKAYLDRLWETLISLEKISGVLIRNLESLAWLKKKGYQGEILSDANLYTWNQYARHFWESQGLSLTAPLELTGREWENLNISGMEVCTYGRTPMMVTANCIKKTGGYCKKKEVENGEDFISLKDRYQKQFPVETDCRHCYNVIYNSVPLSLHGSFLKLLALEPAGFRLSFVTEGKEEMKRVAGIYGGLLQGKNPDTKVLFSYTTGHWKRSAE